MYNVYAIRDSKADTYCIPFHLATDGLARRALCDLVNEERSTIHAYPEDFALYCLATWDELSGEYMSFAPRHICNAVDFVNFPARDDESAVMGDSVL